MLILEDTQATFAYLKSSIETIEKVWNMFKVDNKNTRKRRSGVFIVNFEQISHLFLVFLLLPMNKYMLVELVLP